MTSECSSQPALEALGGERQDVLETGKVREALWYPVGILLALLAASGLSVLCWPGRWIG